jgi:hypothetical protein
MTNINKLTWDYIENNIEIKKTLLAGLVNISALARQIAKENHIEKNIDAIISAVRRFEGKPEVKNRYMQLYALLKKAKISTKTKLASILVKRNDETEKKVGAIYSKIALRRESTLRIFEVSNYIKIIMDDDFFEDVKKIFTAKEIEAVEKNLGELTINYMDDITKIPGVFATLANEMALNGVSIIDSMICHWEHILIVKEDALEKAFAVVLHLTR